MRAEHMNKVCLLIFMVPFTACHTNPAAAAPPKIVGPAVDIDVEDTVPGQPKREVHFSLMLGTGQASVVSSDADERYKIEAHVTSESKLAVSVRRTGGASELDVATAIPPKSDSPVLLAKIDHTGGKTTQVIASPR